MSVLTQKSSCQGASCLFLAQNLDLVLWVFLKDFVSSLDAAVVTVPNVNCIDFFFALVCQINCALWMEPASIDAMFFA
jgi:hypothetical protein